MVGAFRRSDQAEICKDMEQVCALFPRSRKRWKQKADRSGAV